MPRITIEFPEQIDKNPQRAGGKGQDVQSGRAPSGLGALQLREQGSERKRPEARCCRQ